MKTSSNYKYIIAVSGFIIMATVFSIVNSVSTILLAPVTTARGFSISEYSLLFTINAITVAICSPIVGTLLNKINIKIIMSVCSILTSVGYFMYGLAESIFSFYIVGIIVSIGMCGLTTIPISTMISDWFEPNKKGSMIGIVFAGIGTGTFFWMQIVSSILENYSYNMVYFLLAIVILVVSLPISLFIVKRPSKIYENAKLAASNKNGKKSKGLKDIPITFSIVTFIVGLFLMGLSIAGVKQHFQSYLSLLGYPLEFNANIGSTIAVVGIVGNIVGGIIFDKFNPKKVLTVVGFLTTLSIVILMFADIPTFAYSFAVLFGMTIFVLSIWPALGASKIASDDNYSIVFGVSNMFVTIGASIGPFLSGVIADLSPNGYKTAWCIYFVVTIIYYTLFIKSLSKD